MNPFDSNPQGVNILFVAFLGNQRETFLKI